MIRPKEITNVVFLQIIEEIIRNGYEGINFIVEESLVHISAEKIYQDHNFNLKIFYDDVSKVAELSVSCLTPVPVEKLIFCLKLLNYCTAFEEKTKYVLCPQKHIIECTTIKSIFDSNISPGKCINLDIDCSIENITDIYRAIEIDDVVNIINPITFYNCYRGLESTPKPSV